MQKLTESAIAKLAVPQGERDSYLWDSSLPGFGVRKFEPKRDKEGNLRSHASYVVKYTLPSGKQRKMSLGTVQTGMLAEARKAAANILLQARQGQDFVGQKRPLKKQPRSEKSAKPRSATMSTAFSRKSREWSKRRHIASLSDI